ncbi:MULTISPECIES: SPFH domain-containing protein [unclassified Streptomyces]|uniref:SPFH domain-containing protein n=1 Tax=unclassified Streptomyces TaxID=2593676 RepID=UPI0023672B88|nr:MULTISPECIES: SPFH domain-containing protein [unclassified Streptomyces]MDF3143857.1 SPFH domain-containing protein [Streptomyces sp. T21Q-yed]WDF40416.1 SPFH domain-containing protein [Streptomyces sp. T12]
MARARAKQGARRVAEAVASGTDPRTAAQEELQRQIGGRGTRTDGGEGYDAQGQGIDPADFPAAREQGGSTATVMRQKTVPLDEAGEALGRSEQVREGTEMVHAICPMVIPKGRSIFSMLPVLMLFVLSVVGAAIVGASGADVLTNPLFGVHSWLISLLAVAFVWWRQGMVMVPDGCQAMITRFGKLEKVVGPGRIVLLSPWKRVSYIVNTTIEYPFNAPVREAPTKGGVKASIDLFIQFRISDPTEFVYTLGAVRGFEEKLSNAVSETIRTLVYEQEAAGIYDMVGEDTGRLLDLLNQQFRPAVELTNANITHAEPSDQRYRMDLAAPEMVRVAKEAYTHEYALQLRKEQDEGDLTRELASSHETLSAIQADIAQYQAQMDTAVERETNRAQALARQRYVQAESEAKANAALLEAQALDIRAVTAAEAPEILEYRYQQQVLDTLEQVADHLPRLVRIGGTADAGIDFLELARELVGERGTELFTEEDTAAVRARLAQVSERIAAREAEIGALLAADRPTVLQVPDQPESTDSSDSSDSSGSVGSSDVSEEAAQ